MLLFKCTRRAGWLVGATLALTAPVAHAGDTKPDKAEKPAKVVGKAETKPGALAPAKNAACAERTFTKVFSPWHDRALYTLAEGGDFEAQAAGWTLAGPTSIAADSSPFLLGATLGMSSLELPAGASAVSPPICVTRGFPSFRLLARSVSADQASSASRCSTPRASRSSPAGSGRAPSGRRPARSRSRRGASAVRHGASTFVRLRFAATEGSVRLDDVYVTPATTATLPSGVANTARRPLAQRSSTTFAGCGSAPIAVMTRQSRSRGKESHAPHHSLEAGPVHRCRQCSNGPHGPRRRRREDRRRRGGLRAPCVHHRLRAVGRHRALHAVAGWQLRVHGHGWTLTGAPWSWPGAHRSRPASRRCRCRPARRL